MKLKYLVYETTRGISSEMYGFCVMCITIFAILCDFQRHYFHDLKKIKRNYAVETVTYDSREGVRA